MNEDTEQKQSGYAKRPLWQWIAIYAVIAVVVYGAIYYLFLGNKSSSAQALPYGGTTVFSTPELSPAPPAATITPSDNIYKVKNDPVKGDYLTDFQGLTLYTFDKDKLGVSNCIGSCATLWPPYISGAAATQLPADITVITRSDGSKQYAWKDMPLYYYSMDKVSGDINGDGFNGLWHIIKSTSSVSAPTPTSAPAPAY